MTSLDMLGYIAACCTTASFLPQAIKVIRTGDTASLSLIMYVVFNIGVFLWMVYGYLRNDYAIVLANLVTLGLGLLILGLKIYHTVRGREAADS